MNTKRLLLSAALMGLALPITTSLEAASSTVSSTVGQIIRDNDANGLADTVLVNTPITSITDVRVTFNITGGWNGDYYAYLRHGDDSLAVLLDHVGTPGMGGFGYADPGYGPDAAGEPFTLSDSGASSVHDYQADSPLFNGSGQLTGIWQPDGSSFAAAFGGSDPNGPWTLFIADNSTVGVGKLEEWGLTVEGTVPDGGPTACLLCISLLMGGVTWHFRERRL